MHRRWSLDELNSIRMNFVRLMKWIKRNYSVGQNVRIGMVDIFDFEEIDFRVLATISPAQMSLSPVIAVTISCDLKAFHIPKKPCSNRSNAPLLIKPIMQIPAFAL